MPEWKRGPGAGIARTKVLALESGILEGGRLRVTASDADYGLDASLAGAGSASAGSANV